MRTVVANRFRKSFEEGSCSLEEALVSRVVGQPAAVSSIIPYVQMYQAGLSPEGRPAGVFLLLGPSGTGKTRTVEALAAALHGSDKYVLKVDCGEYQMEHEVAKLIGAPPGYLGHRETHPLLSQARVNSVTSERSSVSIVLFDEIEKAAPSMTRLLLGVLDKGTLRLGDNNTVNFERSLIFMTSNLGASEMSRTITPDFGFEACNGPLAAPADLGRQLEKVGLQAVRRRFSPEFVNRIDSVITYQPLSSEAIVSILDLQLAELEQHITNRLGVRAFSVRLNEKAREFLIEHGTSAQYGARELKRTIHRHLMQPLSVLVASDQIEPGSVVFVELADSGDRLRFFSEVEQPRRQRRPDLRLAS
jgi:ATP-dependent Clp protease ATP-binding subunit ClpA